MSFFPNPDTQIQNPKIEPQSAQRYYAIRLPLSAKKLKKTRGGGVSKRLAESEVCTQLNADLKGCFICCFLLETLNPKRVTRNYI